MNVKEQREIAALFCFHISKILLSIHACTLKGFKMKKVVTAVVLTLTVAACSAPTTEPVETMVVPEPTSQKL